MKKEYFVFIQRAFVFAQTPCFSSWVSKHKSRVLKNPRAKAPGVPGFLTFVGLIIIVAILVYYTPESDAVRSVCFSEVCVDVEVVDTPESRARGLMFRESLADDSGMFFIFEEVGNYPFWMKNTLIPLDIIWLDEEFRVVYIANAVPCVGDPCTNYNPNANAKYVVEVNAGFAEKNGVGVGDVVGIMKG